MAHPTYDAKTGNIIINGVEWEFVFAHPRMAPSGPIEKVSFAFCEKNKPMSRLGSKGLLPTERALENADGAVAIYYARYREIPHDDKRKVIIRRLSGPERMYFNEDGSLAMPPGPEDRGVLVQIPGLSTRQCQLPEGIELWDFSNAGEVGFLLGFE